MDYVPLGGDGFYAPFAMYNVRLATLAGDASGGLMTLSLTMDPRFCSLVSYVTAQVAGAAADNMIRLTVGGGRIAGATFQGLVDAATQFTRVCAVTWQPPALILPGGTSPAALGQHSINFQANNVDGDTFTLDAAIYMFNIRAREITPMGPLLWARGSGTSGGQSTIS